MKFSIDVSLNTGAALVIWIIGFFILVGLMAVCPPIANLCVPVLTGWTGGLVSILFKKVADDKHDLEAARGDLGPRLNEIKIQAANSCPPERESYEGK